MSPISIKMAHNIFRQFFKPEDDLKVNKSNGRKNIQIWIKTNDLQNFNSVYV